MPQPDASGPPAILFRCDCDQSLAFDSAPVAAGLQSAQIALVHLDDAQQPLPAWPDHGAPQFVQARPGSLVAPPAKHLLQTPRADPVLLAGHPPHGAEPYRQRRARILEHRSRGRRCLMSADGALPAPRTQGPSLVCLAARTAKPFRPAQLKQILPAGRFVAETSLQLSQRARVILTLHTAKHYRLGLPESNG